MFIFAAMQCCESSRREAASRHNSFALAAPFPIFLLFVSYKSHILTIAGIHRGPLNVSNVDKPLEGMSSKCWLQHTPSGKKKKQKQRLCSQSKFSLWPHGVQVFTFEVWNGVQSQHIQLFFCNKSTQHRKHHPRRKVCALVVSSHLCVSIRVINLVWKLVKAVACSP